MLNKFLTKFLPKAVAPSRRGRPARRNAPGRQLKLECLENRLTLSSSPFIVTSGADSGAGSLRAAIASAVPGETIKFANSVHSITLTSGELPISTSLTIEGPGAGKLTISGDNNSRIFDVSGAVSVTIAGVTIADGLVNTTNTGDAIDPSWGGGGILNNDATLTLVNDTLTNNQAVGVPGQDEFGGGLFNYLGSATVSGCTFTGNQVTGAGSGDAIGGSAGGAIDNYGGATLVVANSTFSNNSVVSTAGLFYFALGGAIESNAGVAGATPSTATLTDCKFLDNLAQAGAQALSNGGAILSEGPGTSMTLTGCQISGNRSVGGADGIDQTGQGLGGGVMNAGSMVITGCTITDNQAVGGNNGSPLQQPWNGAGFGGGIENAGTLTVSGSTVSGNIAQGGANASGPGSNAYGGGIQNGATMTVTDSLISNNVAIAGQGGAGASIATVGAAGFGGGGGIDSSGTATATLTNCTIVNNLAQGSAGTAGNSGGDGVGGGLLVGNQVLSGYYSDSQVTVVGCTIVGNRALGGTGGHGANGGDGLGGGVAVFGGAVFGGLVAEDSVDLTDSTVALNLALGGEEGYGHGGSDGNGVGGGIYNDQGTLNANATDLILANFASTSNNNIGP